MKFLHLVYANILRKKMRFFLTIGSFGVALFLFGILVAIHNGFYQGIDAVEDNRLVVRNKTSLMVFLPYSYKAKIEAMEKQEPAMWANSSNIISARISTERGSAGDQHTCSETKTAYHDTPLYLATGG